MVLFSLAACRISANTDICLKDLEDIAGFNFELSVLNESSSFARDESFARICFSAIRGNSSALNFVKLQAQTSVEFSGVADWILKHLEEIRLVDRSKDYMLLTHRLIDLVERWHNELLLSVLQSNFSKEEFLRTIRVRSRVYGILHLIRKDHSELEMDAEKRRIAGILLHDEYSRIVQDISSAEIFLLQLPHASMSLNLNKIFSTASRVTRNDNFLVSIVQFGILKSAFGLAVSDFDVTTTVPSNLELTDPHLSKLLTSSVVELIHNAKKYNFEKNKKRSIRIRWENNSLFIADNGPGISDVSKVGALGYREPAYANYVRGTGTGIHSMIERLKPFGISLHIQSKVGEGSVFELRFPPGLVRN